MITDSIESCFSFEGLDADNYIFNSELPLHINYAETLKKTGEIEEKIRERYLDSAEISKSLMADIPRVFERLVF